MLPNKGLGSKIIAANGGFEKVAINNHERVIVYRLGATQVFFDQANALIYFADLDESPVYELLGMLDKNTPQSKLQSLYLDVNHYFPCGYRASLISSTISPLLVALRLKGIHIEYVLPKANIDNPDTPWFISKPIV